MSLSVGDALRDGLGRTFERNGLMLIGVFVVLRLLATVADQTLTRANLSVARELGTLPAGAGALPGLGDAPTPYALALGITGAFVLAIAVALFAETVRIVAVRTLVSDRTDTVPVAYATRNILFATVNGFVGGIVVLTLTVIGLVALVVPGVFLALSFFFVRQEIAVRDVNFVDAMAGSWELASGHRFQLLGLGAVLVLIGLIASIPGVLIGAVAPAVGTAVGVIARAVVIVFGVASAARAYEQLRSGDEPDEPAETADDPTLTADDLAPPDDASP